MEGFPHAGVLAEERFAVVLDPVDHLRETKQAGHQNGLRGRRCVFVLQVSVPKHLRAHELGMEAMKPA